MVFSSLLVVEACAVRPNHPGFVVESRLAKVGRLHPTSTQTKAPARGPTTQASDRAIHATGLRLRETRGGSGPLVRRHNCVR